MPDPSRIEALRRRVQKDPASAVFVQLAEEYRRAGNYREAVRTCRAGLTHNPGYLSARVTLGRSLIELGDLDGAQVELQYVRRVAPDNLAALRGLAGIHHCRDEWSEALTAYRTALALAPHDQDLRQRVEELSHRLGPGRYTRPGGVESASAGFAAGEGTSLTPDVRAAGARGSLAHPALPVLERWLEAIVADRQQRV